MNIEGQQPARISIADIAELHQRNLLKYTFDMSLLSFTTLLCKERA